MMETSRELYARCSEDGLRRQLLKDHCENVANLTAASCGLAELEKLGRFTGFVHDCHKAAPEWQEYFRAGQKGQNEGKMSHAPQAAKWIWKRYGERAKDRGGKIAAQIAAMAVYSHHNTLFDVLTPEGEALFNERLVGEEIDESGVDLFCENVVSLSELDGLFSAAAREVEAAVDALEHTVKKSVADDAKENAKRETRHFFEGLIARFVFSALIDADRYDAACFEAGVEPVADDSGAAGWKRLISAFESNLGGRVAEVTKKADPRITAARQSISNSCREFAKNGAGVYRLYVPTGAGKSFAALRFALYHAAEREKSRVIVVEPYLTVIDQIAEEYRGVLGDQADAVLEYHSNITLEARETKAGRLLAERFDSRVVVTTLVQFLETLFSGKGGSARRLRSFANAVIILDEIQAIPAKCVDMFNLAARFLADVCGATVVLCTATQPEFASAEHPLLLDEPKDMVGDFGDMFDLFRRVEVIDDQNDLAYTADELAELIRDCGEEEQSVLAVVNTKSAALALYARLAAAPGQFEKVFFLSTQMCPAHRLETISQIKTGLSNGTRLLVVSTSLIEFGVDLSFDCVVRSVAGVPSIAQVAGRCNRHGKFQSKRVFVVNFAAERLGSLREIEIGQNISQMLLRMLRKQKRSVTDLLSPEIISTYYKNFFQQCRPFMCYKAETGVSNFTTLIELLSSNQTARAYSKKALDPDLLHQSFKTAGKQFKVIEDGTIGVIVPYGDGARIIEELCAPDFDIARTKALLREAQRFTVNVFEGRLRELYTCGCIRELERVGAIALKDGFYNKATGISTEVDLNPDDYMV